MRIPTRTQDRGFAFNITLLIDVVFLLIVVFLVTSDFIRNESMERIEFPVASRNQDDWESSKRLVVTVIPTGELKHGTASITAEEFEQRLKTLIAQNGVGPTELRIRADRRVAYSRIEPLLLTAARNGVTRVTFAVLKN